MSEKIITQIDNSEVSIDSAGDYFLKNIKTDTQSDDVNEHCRFFVLKLEKKIANI